MAARDVVEAALDAVARQVKALARGTHRQVRGAEEIAALKSLAYSWFESFKPELLRSAVASELVAADEAFRTILDATAHLSARSSYSQQLRAAKEALVRIRSVVTERQAMPRPNGNAQGVEPAPLFTSLAADPRMQEILARRWQEIEKCLAGGANLAATVMMGGLLESLFLARINRVQVKKAIFTAKAAPKDRQTGSPLPLGDWTLKHYIEVSHELKWITKSAKEVGSVLREFRNYIHPHKEMVDGVTVGESDAEMFWALAKTMTKQVLASTNTPPV